MSRLSFQNRPGVQGINGLFTEWTTPSQEKFLDRAKYDFMLDKVAVRHFTQDENEVAYGHRFPKRFVLRRLDNNQPLAVISDRYKPILHGHLVNTLDGAARQIGRFERRTAVNLTGSKFIAEYKFPDTVIKVNDKGDELELTLTATNSYDLSSPLRLSIGAFRMICSNGMFIGELVGFDSHKHTLNVNLDVLAGKFADAGVTFKANEEAFKEFRAMRLDMPTAHGFDKRIEEGLVHLHTPVAARWRKKVYARFACAEDRSVWGWYNAATYVASHECKAMKPAQDLLVYAKESSNLLMSELRAA